MIKINTTQKDFFENNKFVLTYMIFENEIVEIEFTDATVEFIVKQITRIKFSDDTKKTLDLLNFLGQGIKRTLIYRGDIYFDLKRYQVFNDDIKTTELSQLSQYQCFTRFNEIKIITKSEVKNFKRLGSKK